jgi:hypothetical protein
MEIPEIRNSRPIKFKYFCPNCFNQLMLLSHSDIMDEHTAKEHTTNHVVGCPHCYYFAVIEVSALVDNPVFDLKHQHSSFPGRDVVPFPS